MTRMQTARRVSHTRGGEEHYMRIPMHPGRGVIRFPAVTELIFVGSTMRMRGFKAQLYPHLIICLFLVARLGSGFLSGMHQIDGLHVPCDADWRAFDCTDNGPSE